MKVKARLRGARNHSAQSQQAAQPGQKYCDQLASENQDLPQHTGPSEAYASFDASASSSAASIHTPRSAGATPAHISASSIVAAAASRPALVIGTTSAAARSALPPSRALTQQQLRRQRQQQRATLPPVRARGAAASASRQARGVGGATTTDANPTSGAWTTAAAAAATAAAVAAVTGAAGGRTDATSTAALNGAVKVVERALEEGPEGQERLRRLSMEQPDLYSQVILALFRKTQSLDLISRMPMPMMPEPDFMMDPPLPGADFDLDLAWEEGEEGEELDYWEVMAAEGGLYKGGVDGLYDMPYDLDDIDAPFPEPPFPDFDYYPGFEDEEDDLYDDDEYYYDETEEEEEEEGEGFGSLEGKGIVKGGGGLYSLEGAGELAGKGDEMLPCQQRGSLAVSCGAVDGGSTAAAAPRHDRQHAMWRADGAAVYDGAEEETLSRELRDLHLAPKPLYPVPS